MWAFTHRGLRCRSQLFGYLDADGSRQVKLAEIMQARQIAPLPECLKMLGQRTGHEIEWGPVLRGITDAEGVQRKLGDAVLKQGTIKLSKLFRQFDASGDGLLPLAELVEALKELAFDGSPEVVQQIFDEIDSGGSGSIGFMELKNWLRGVEDPEIARHKKADAWTLGANLDEDDDGELEEDELRAALRALLEADGVPLHEIFHKWDRDGSGDLRKKELLRAIKTMVSDDARWQEEVRPVVQQVWAILDRDNSSTVELVELERWLYPERKGQGAYRAKAARRSIQIQPLHVLQAKAAARKRVVGTFGSSQRFFNPAGVGAPSAGAFKAGTSVSESSPAAAKKAGGDHVHRTSPNLESRGESGLLNVVPLRLGGMHKPLLRYYAAGVASQQAKCSRPLQAGGSDWLGASVGRFSVHCDSSNLPAGTGKRRSGLTTAAVRLESRPAGSCGQPATPTHRSAPARDSPSPRSAPARPTSASGLLSPSSGGLVKLARSEDVECTLAPFRKGVLCKDASSGYVCFACQARAEVVAQEHRPHSLRASTPRGTCFSAPHPPSQDYRPPTHAREQQQSPRRGCVKRAW